MAAPCDKGAAWGVGVMAELIADCPRCGAAKTGFIATNSIDVYLEHGWLHTLEAWAICRNCRRSTTFVLRQREYKDTAQIKDHGISKFSDSLNNHFSIRGHVSPKDENRRQPPEHLPANIATAFNEGATCLAVQCWNAAAVMFRVCVDLATRGLLPEEAGGGEQPNSKQRRDLGLRLPWLFDHGLLPEGLRDLSSCIHQDGNDGAHEGTLTKEDAEDLVDFTEALLQRLFTEPKRLELAAARRTARREK